MIIETLNLTKLYDGKPGCRDICLSVSEGQVFGFLGPNGAGKSTVVKTLIGLLRPTDGQGMVLGQPLGNKQVRRKIGFLPENFRFQEWLTGRELLEFHGAMYGLERRFLKERIPVVLEMVRLRGREREPIRSYSKGMQQRLGIASALLPDPELVFLDEPTSALDPIGRREIREIIKNLRSESKTVFLNSHLLSEVEMTCDHVAFIKGGIILDQGRLSNFTGGKQVVSLRYTGSPRILESIRAVSQEVFIDNGLVQVAVASEDLLPVLASIVVQNGGDLYEMTTSGFSLEDVFINIMGEAADDYHCTPHLSRDAE
ncbi:MAG: ABC transporter ATP-binding protein [Syntrophomonadaceae bacterium]|jgi:ABC-2 type transport system ATP-binding protein|nr:ABC transporter ATP-binding protein [Syntrophomonadaceae bacterium]